MKLDHITQMGTILPVGSKSEQKHYIVVTSVSRLPTPRDVIAVTGAKSINETPWDAQHAMYKSRLNEWLYKCIQTESECIYKMYKCR